MTSPLNAPGARRVTTRPPSKARLMEQRDGEHGARPCLEHRSPQSALVGACRRDVRDLDRLPRDRHLADAAFASAQARCPQHRGLDLRRH